MPGINYFQVVGAIINDAVKAIAAQRGVPQDEIHAKIKEYLERNSREWRTGRQPDIPYQDPLCRLAYLYHNVPVNANIIQRIFEYDSELSSHFDSVHDKKSDVSICVFGGGPGPELLDIAKWAGVRGRRLRTALSFLLLDHVREWAEDWLALKRCVRQRCGSGVEISGDFLPIDITDRGHFATLGRVFTQDIYVLSYVLSEIFENRKVAALRHFVTDMATHAPPGAKFLFVDRDEPKWQCEVANLCRDANMSLSKFQKSVGSMDADEDKESLGGVYSAMDPRKPRLTWDAFWAVGTTRSATP